METVAVSQAPVVSGSSAPVSPLFVRRVGAAFPPAVSDFARSFLSLVGSASLRAVSGLAGTTVPVSGEWVLLCPSLVVLRRLILLGQLGLLPLLLLCPVRPVDWGESWGSPVPVGAVVARPAVGSTDRDGVTGRALSSPVRSSSRWVASYPFSSLEEERAGLPPPTAGCVPGGTPSVSRPAPAGDRSPRSCLSGFELRSSALAGRSRLGLSGSLSPPPAGGGDIDHSVTVDFLDFGFLPVCPGSHVKLPCLGRAGTFPYARWNPRLHQSLGFNVGVSPALFLPFSLLCYGRFLSPLS